MAAAVLIELVFVCENGLASYNNIIPVPRVVEFELPGKAEGGAPQLSLLEHTLPYPGKAIKGTQKTRNMFPPIIFHTSGR